MRYKPVNDEHEAEDGNTRSSRQHPADPCTCGGFMCWALLCIVISAYFVSVSFPFFTTEGSGSSGVGLLLAGLGLLGGGIYLSVIWSRIQAQDEDYYDEHDPCTCGGSMCWAIVSIVSSIIWFVVAFSMFSEGLPSNGAGLIYMAVVMLGVGIFLCVICTRISNRRKGINKAKPRWLKQEMSSRRSPENGYSNEVASSGPQRAASASSSVPLLSNNDRRGADEEDSSAGGAGNGEGTTRNQMFRDAFGLLLK